MTAPCTQLATIYEFCSNPPEGATLATAGLQPEFFTVAVSPVGRVPGHS